MAAKLVHSPMSAPHVALPPTPKKMIPSYRKPISTTQSRTNENPRFGNYSSSGLRPIRVADQSSGLVEDEEQEKKEEKEDDESSYLKTQLYGALQGVNRGIFGVPSTKKSEIEGLVKLLESMNPTPEPTLFLDKVGGCWKLIYCTITILGSKRTKLGLRDFITLGEFFQSIDVTEGKAVNVIMFEVRGLNLFNGQLKIEASFEVASNSRVNIKFNETSITPDRLMNIFQKNYKLLLGIFNPEGWLEITYVDDSLRIGRDNKGNIFVLEKCEENQT